VLLVDARLRVLHVNQAARVLLARRDCLATDAGTVQALDPAADRALASAVASAVRSADGGLAIALTRPGAGPVLLHVLSGGGPMSADGRGAFAVILALTASACGGSACEALAEMCGLTVAETDVLRAIVAGDSPAEAAASLGIGVATVRTHLLRIYAKTGVDGQPGLVRLASALRPV
jgi:DNA-binding CsgD family transcriptional regulator